MEANNNASAPVAVNEGFFAEKTAKQRSKFRYNEMFVILYF